MTKAEHVEMQTTIDPWSRLFAIFNSSPLSPKHPIHELVKNCKSWQNKYEQGKYKFEYKELVSMLQSLYAQSTVIMTLGSGSAISSIINSNEKIAKKFRTRVPDPNQFEQILFELYNFYQASQSKYAITPIEEDGQADFIGVSNIDQEMVCIECKCIDRPNDNSVNRAFKRASEQIEQTKEAHGIPKAHGILSIGMKSNTSEVIADPDQRRTHLLKLAELINRRVGSGLYSSIDGVWVHWDEILHTEDRNFFCCTTLKKRSFIVDRREQSAHHSTDFGLHGKLLGSVPFNQTPRITRVLINQSTFRENAYFPLNIDRFSLVDALKNIVSCQTSLINKSTEIMLAVGRTSSGPNRHILVVATNSAKGTEVHWATRLPDKRFSGTEMKEPDGILLKILKHAGGELVFQGQSRWLLKEDILQVESASAWNALACAPLGNRIDKKNTDTVVLATNWPIGGVEIVDIAIAFMIDRYKLGHWATAGKRPITPPP